jgi:hypothetical protein
MNISVRSKLSRSNPSIEIESDGRESMEDLPLCGLSPKYLVGCRQRNGKGRGSWARGLSPTVLVGARLGGREREARMGESLGWRGKEEDGGEMRET